MKTVAKLRPLLLASRETVQDFMFAMDDRYWDAIELAVGERQIGAIYLFGFVGEIVLKHAILRVQGAKPSDIATSFFVPWKNLMKVSHPAEDPESFHSIHWLMLLLRLKRQQIASPLPQSLDQQLVTNACLLHDQWKIDLRYRRVIVDPVNVEVAYNAAEWFWRNRFRL